MLHAATVNFVAMFTQYVVNMNNFAYDVFITLFCSCAVFTIPNKGDVNEDDRKHECIHSCIKFLLFIAKNL